MIRNEVIVSLKEKAKQDAALEATLTMFAARERARSQVTVRGLQQRMKNEGWDNFDEHDYKRVLKTLAGAGIGKLETASGGKVTALTEIKITLQSLGQAVLDGTAAKLEQWSSRNRYEPATPVKVVAAAAPQVKAPLPDKALMESPTHPLRRSTDRNEPEAAITIRFNGKPIVMSLPEEFTEQEIAEFLTRVRSWKRDVSGDNRRR